MYSRNKKRDKFTDLSHNFFLDFLFLAPFQKKNQTLRGLSYALFRLISSACYLLPSVFFFVQLGNIFAGIVIYIRYKYKKTHSIHSIRKSIFSYDFLRILVASKFVTIVQFRLIAILMPSLYHPPA